MNIQLDSHWKKKLRAYQKKMDKTVELLRIQCAEANAKVAELEEAVSGLRTTLADTEARAKEYSDKLSAANMEIGRRKKKLKRLEAELKGKKK